jgi:hypothetical protein
LARAMDWETVKDLVKAMATAMDWETVRVVVLM